MLLNHPTKNRAGASSGRDSAARRRRTSRPTTRSHRVASIGNDEVPELARDIRALIDADLIAPITDAAGVMRYAIDNNDHMENR